MRGHVEIVGKLRSVFILSSESRNVRSSTVAFLLSSVIISHRKHVLYAQASAAEPHLTDLTVPPVTTN